MNFKEGTRRLALLLGAVGAIAGVFVACIELQDVLRHRALHNRFEQSANSDPVQQKQKILVSECRGRISMKAPDGKDGCVPKESKDAAIKSGFVVLEDGGDSTVDNGEIKSIHWNREYRVDSILTEDGQTLYPTPAPAWWPYALVAVFPFIGFTVPWGLVRAIGWVGAGFVQPSR